MFKSWFYQLENTFAGVNFELEDWEKGIIDLWEGGGRFSCSVYGFIFQQANVQRY